MISALFLDENSQVSEAPRALRGFLDLNVPPGPRKLAGAAGTRVVSALLANPSSSGASPPGKEEGGGRAWEGGECVLRREASPLPT